MDHSRKCCRQQACCSRTALYTSPVTRSCVKGWLSSCASTRAILAATMPHRHLPAAHPHAAWLPAFSHEPVQPMCSHWPVTAGRRAGQGGAHPPRAWHIAMAIPRQQTGAGMSRADDTSRFTPDYIEKLQQLQPMMTPEAIQHLRQATPADQRADLERLLEDIQLLSSGWLHQYASGQAHNEPEHASQELPAVFVRYLQQEVFVGLAPEQFEAALDLMGRDTLQVIARLYEELVELQQTSGDEQLLKAKVEELSCVMSDILSGIEAGDDRPAGQQPVEPLQQEQAEQPAAEQLGANDTPAAPGKRTTRKRANQLATAAAGADDQVVDSVVQPVAGGTLLPSNHQHSQGVDRVVVPQAELGQAPQHHHQAVQGVGADGAVQSAAVPEQQQGVGSTADEVVSGVSSSRVSRSGRGTGSHQQVADPAPPLQHASVGSQPGSGRSKAGPGVGVGSSSSSSGKGGWLLKRPSGSAWAWAESPLTSTDALLGQQAASGLRGPEGEQQSDTPQVVQSRIKLIGKRTVSRRRAPREAPYSPTAVQARPNSTDGDE